MNELYLEVLIVFSAFCPINIQARCSCGTVNTCYQNYPATDGSEEIDVRIDNPGTSSCEGELDSCCVHRAGCGIRYNIPITPTTTPGPGQGRYGAQPWDAIILGDDDNSYVGGGALLDSFHVLTVAHKVFNRTASSIKVRLGEWNANQAVEPFPLQEAGVSQITQHPNFDVHNLQNDVAILRLSSPIELDSNPAINTVCLPSATPLNKFDNLRCMVYGWGKEAFTGSLQSIVREVVVPIIDSNTCQAQLRSTRLGPSFDLNPMSFICAGGETHEDACIGDGGFPLVCNIGGKHQVAGLVAWGIGCGTASVPGVYVRVQSFVPWIIQNLN